MEGIDSELTKSSVSLIRVHIVLTFLAALLLTAGMIVFLVPALNKQAITTSLMGTALALVVGLLPLWIIIAFATGLVALSVAHRKRTIVENARGLVSVMVGLGLYNVILSAVIVGVFVVLFLWVGFNVPI